MNLTDLQNDPFFIKFIQRTARMLGEWYQEKASSMTTDELYTDSEFFPLYNPDRDYSLKPNGYVCRKEDGTMMRLIKSDTAAISTFSLNSTGKPSLNWQQCWSTIPIYAKEFMSSIDSPYGVGECCLYEGIVYKSLKDSNMTSPKDAPETWERI